MFRPQNRCNGKTAYPSKEKANETAKHLNGLGGKRVVAYHCKDCGSVHVGHESKGKKLGADKTGKNKIIHHNHVPGVHRIKLDDYES